MSVDSVPVQGTLRGVAVRLPGEIDHTNVEGVRTALADALEATAVVLVADMTGTTYCCSEGLRVLIEADRAAQQAGTPLRIAGVHPRVHRILMLTGASELLSVYPSAEAALAHSTAGPASAGMQAGGLG